MTARDLLASYDAGETFSWLKPSISPGLRTRTSGNERARVTGRPPREGEDVPAAERVLGGNASIRVN